MMTLTRKMIDDGKSDRGAWSANQLAILGVSWPPLRGWPDRIIGTEISEEGYQHFLAIRKRSKASANVPQEKPVAATAKAQVPLASKEENIWLRIREIAKEMWALDRQRVTEYMESLSNAPRAEFAEWVMEEHYRLARIENARADQSPETFANSLFLKEGGKLD